MNSARRAWSRWRVCWRRDAYWYAHTDNHCRNTNGEFEHEKWDKNKDLAIWTVMNI